MSKIIAAQSRAHTESKTVENRRHFWPQTVAVLRRLWSVSGMVGCTPPLGATIEPDLVWGRLGNAEGRLMRPRAMTIDEHEQTFTLSICGKSPGL